MIGVIIFYEESIFIFRSVGKVQRSGAEGVVNEHGGEGLTGGAGVEMRRLDELPKDVAKKEVRWAVVMAIP